ncbi:IAA-alanine resistance protein 1 isoform X1 [Oryza brachyantha]|uniref:IAA-alanine resistance protein 1 isoform X1 n=1 Tax=Oryza brachyantha TaxID=4533 RepID=UPI001ADB7907|nr:IAA-alanine resistance protein 1 isoform X1 [Oryza brachyantha]XP_040382851.1 IAA-alanine resistance protein 1 isoform X1 [Oryza brachyantha]XP_040382852.1 IAA-alanine resistance protein 1 isoform X1 [Oryza brachyantha]
MRRGLLVLLLLAAAIAGGGGQEGSSCPFHAHDQPHDDHHHGHGHSCGGDPHHEHHHHHGHGHGHGHDHGEIQRRLLPEELAEEADLELDGFGHHDHHHDHHHGHGDFQPELSPLGMWLSAMGCSLLVSMASLVCLVLLPVIFFQGKPSKTMVDCLAIFGAGAMLGDSFLHQLPHAFVGGHSHAHDHQNQNHSHEHSHAHSLEDLSVGLSVLFGIVLFFVVEKIVRYVEDNSHKGAHGMGHHHHHHKRHEISDKAKLNHTKKDHEDKGIEQTEKESLHDGAIEKTDGVNHADSKFAIHKRGFSSGSNFTDRKPVNSESDPVPDKALSSEDSSVSNSNMVFGYLNLFSDGVHNFTDGMALGSAFLLHGSVGGWSRTLFLLAHELPQEVGDFGILVRSGFTVTKALFFNFLSALVALAGTALALSLGKDPGHSSLIEGFTAGGFIYIAVAGVLPEMNDQKTTIKSSMIQLISLAMGMLVALGISLVE